MNYTVIATTFNDGKEIEAYLGYITSQTLLPTEIIIVDGGSKDDTIAKAEAYRQHCGLNLRVITDRGRLNISQGYNVGVAEATCDMILITGVGNIYDKDFARHLVECYEGGDYDMVYCPTYGVNQNTFAKNFNSVFLRGSKGKRYPLPSNRAVLINKNVFAQVGYFYEHFVYAGEDTEFFMRVAVAGFKIGYTDNAKMYWYTPANLHQYFRKWEVNAIADLQLLPRKKILADAVVKIVAIIVAVSMFIATCTTWYSYAAMVIAVLLLMAWFRTINIGGLLLRMGADYCMIWYRLRHWKYSAQEYHFDTQKIPHYGNTK